MATPYGGASDSINIRRLNSSSGDAGSAAGWEIADTYLSSQSGWRSFNGALAIAIKGSANPTPPSFVSAEADGRDVTLTYNGDLLTDGVVSRNAHDVVAEGDPPGERRYINITKTNGRAVNILLHKPLPAGKDITVTYRVDGRYPVLGANRAAVAPLGDQSVTNNTVSVAPVLDDATVNGSTLTLTYNEPLDTNSTPATRAYGVTVDSSTRGVTNVSVLGSAVTLTLASPVQAGQTVEVSYTPGSSPVQDTGGEDALPFADEPVTNNTVASPPTLVSAIVNGSTLTLTYSEPLDTNSRPATSDYTVTVNSATRGVTNVSVSGSAVTLTLASEVQAGQDVRLTYRLGSNPVQDTGGEDAMALTNEPVTNNTGVLPPGLDSAVVDGDMLTLTYDEPLDEASEPATTAYSTVAREVASVGVSGSTVTLTLASAVVGGETVLVSYDAPEVDPVQDESGNPAANLNNHRVKNITNNALVFTTTGLTVAENTQVVGTVVAEDPDTQDSVTYILKAADPEDDGRMFAITSDGVLSFRAAHGADYEHPGSVGGSNDYGVTVMAMSGSGTRENMTIEQITVTITNAEDDGRLLFSSEQPQVGTALLATVDDPDGSVSVTTWTWEISSDQSNWTTLTHQTTPNAPSSSYAPVAADAADGGKYIRVTADYDDAVTGAEQVQRTLSNKVRAQPASNDAPMFPPSEMGQRSIPEETAPNVNIGLPVIATDAESDLLTYSLDGTDAESFDIVPLSGQLRTEAPLDFETKSSYTVVVTATDPSRETAEITVTITVTDITEQNWNTPGNTNPGGGGGGGGGGGVPFIGGGGPTPSVEDYGWNVTGDIDPLASRNGDPTGLWGDDWTLRVGQNGDGANDGVFAYDLVSHERLEDLEFELAETNRAPRGVWSDGETMWVSDSGQERIFAYDLESGERIEDAEFALSSRNRDARGIWSDGTSMWVLDGIQDALFRYDLASGQSLGEFDLDSDNDDPHGIWSDGTAIWVSDSAGDKKIFAYHQQGQGLTHVGDEDFTGLMRAGNNSPRGIWSDGDLMYVVDSYDDKIYTYNMPDAFDARLASLTLSDVDIGEFSSLKTEYEGVPEDDATETTVAAVAVQDEATIVTAPDDADGNARDGHQVSLDGTAIAVTVTSEDGSRTRVYRVQFEPAAATRAAVAEAPWVECLRDMKPVRFSLVLYEGGTIPELRDCAEEFDLKAIWDRPEQVWISIIFDAPDFVNREFEELFPDGILPITPLFAQRDLPWNFPDREEEPEPIEDAQPQTEVSPRAEPPSEVSTEPDAASVPVIGNTGGDGVSHRNDCADDARLSAIGGWPDGTEVEVLGEGRGRCTGWLLVHADDITSWVRDEYVLGFSAAESAPDEDPGLVIGNTGGEGVSHRNECADEARLSEIGGWPDGTEVVLLEEGSGPCAGWLRVRAGGVTSWVREEYVVESSGGTAATPEIWLVIGNTGGDGVSHRDECSDEARVSELGGWPDGTEVELLEEGSGPCAGWLRVQADAVTSWVREEYVGQSAAAAPSVPNVGRAE